MGLKVKRVDQWLEVLEEESHQMDRRAWWNMMLAGARVALVHPVPDFEFRRRMRICRACPVYDREMKRCRPYTGSPDGCGCYVPFKALDNRPCPARLLNPRLGW